MTNEQLIKKWSRTGLLDEYDDVESKLELSNLFENGAKVLHAFSQSPIIYFNNKLSVVALPILYRIYKRNYLPDPEKVINQLQQFDIKFSIDLEGEMHFTTTFVNEFYPIKPAITLKESNDIILANMARN